MNKLNFKTNWNNKLNCKVFLTIIPQTANNHYKLNDLYEIYLNDKYYKGTAKIILIEEYHISALSDIECLLDTGYTKEETLNILEKMYNFKYYYFELIILKYINQIDENQPPLLTGGC